MDVQFYCLVTRSPELAKIWKPSLTEDQDLLGSDKKSLERLALIYEFLCFQRLHTISLCMFDIWYIPIIIRYGGYLQLIE